MQMKEERKSWSGSVDEAVQEDSRKVWSGTTGSGLLRGTWAKLPPGVGAVTLFLGFAGFAAACASVPLTGFARTKLTQTGNGE